MIKFSSKIMVSLFCSLLLFLFTVNHAPAASPYEPLQAAMLATGARVEEWSLHGWVKLPNGQLTDDELEHIVQETITQLGTDTSQYQFIHQQRKKHHSIQAEMVSPRLRIVVLAQVISPSSAAGQSEGYLVINMEGKEDEIIGIKDMQEKIMYITKKNGHSPQISTCLIGWLDGKLRDGEWQDYLQNAFEIIHAKSIDQITTEHFVSYTGFTPEIAEGIQIGDQTINFNMAMHYSQYDDRTYIIIGSPIITREY